MEQLLQKRNTVVHDVVYVVLLSHSVIYFISCSLS